MRAEPQVYEQSEAGGFGWASNEAFKNQALPLSNIEPPTSRRSTIASVIFVMAIAIGVRWTSLQESFWVDELHSAWCVWGTSTEVFSRSAMGHQSPVWFAGLWVWKQVVGESEFALRMFSVVAVAVGCGVLTGGVAQISRRNMAGLAAGLVLAIESNALFFGTELRPYSAVILFSTIAAVCFARVWQAGSRHEAPASWAGLCIAVGASVLCQPTSAGVLVVLPLLLFRFPDVSRLDVGLITGLIGIAIGLWTTTLGESWSTRETWATFATARHWQQLWHAWDWVWLLILPCALGLVMPKHRGLIAMLSLTVAVTTTCYFAASYFGVMPIWHRRYFVPGLPLMACVIGLAIGSFERQNVTPALAGGTVIQRHRDTFSRSFVAIVLLGGLVWSQGTFGHFPTRPLVVRGEDWRSAIEMVADEPKVAIDAGLIEANWLTAGELSLEQADYLTFVTGGPYQVSADAIPTGPDLRAGDADWIVTRRPVGRFPEAAFPGAKRHGFGGVTVIELPRRVDTGLE